MDLKKLKVVLQRPNMEFAASIVEAEIFRRINMNTKWVKWKSHQGARNMGERLFDPPAPHDLWTKILGVVARCEGKHDTFVSYDNTGGTWGFMQWTMTSGRLQKLLESLKSISFDEDEHVSLFDKFCMNGNKQVFEKYGFKITGGKFVELETGKVLNPNNKKQKQRISDVCMGKTLYKTFKQQKEHAMGLAALFVRLGNCTGVPEAQIAFASQEMQKGLKYTRKPLKEFKTLDNLLEGSWDSPAPALFFNLWINNPAAAYRLTIRARRAIKSGDELFDKMWALLKRSTFGNWSFAKPENRSPRIRRIKKALKEFYNIDVKAK